jgi:hypothetical protein
MQCSQGRLVSCSEDQSRIVWLNRGTQRPLHTSPRLHQLLLLRVWLSTLYGALLYTTLGREDYVHMCAPLPVRGTRIPPLSVSRALGESGERGTLIFFPAGEEGEGEDAMTAGFLLAGGCGAAPVAKG